jgi:hypothetical protein
MPKSYIAGILENITNFYLNSNDFNGISISLLTSNIEELKKYLRDLIKTGNINLNFGDTHPNPHILAFPPEKKDIQIKKLNNLQNINNCCAYPSKLHLENVVKPDNYKNKPYTLLLALGEPQFSYKFFNLRILEFYFNDPRYYYNTNDIEGSVSLKDEKALEEKDRILLQSFGFAYDKKIKSRYIVVFLRYLSFLTPEHQKRWKIEEVNNNIFIHPDYIRITLGHFPEKISIFDAFCEEEKIINDMTKAIWGKMIFRKIYGLNNKPKQFSFLVRPTKKEYDDFIKLLDKLISDNIRKKFFKGELDLKEIIERENNHVEQEKGTIRLLDEFLDKKFRLSNPEIKENMINVFKKIRKKRGPLAHVIQEDNWNHKYFKEQREIIIEAYTAMKDLRLILANHPKTNNVKIYDYLLEGKIWTF